MFNKLLLVPFAYFNAQVLSDVVQIYSQVAGIKNPSGEKIKPAEEIDGILKELRDGHTWCDYTFGSSLSLKSKLFLHQVVDDGLLYVGIGFLVNADNDAVLASAKMRENFYVEVEKYLSKSMFIQ